MSPSPSDTAVQPQPDEPDYDDTPLIGWMVHPRNECLVVTVADDRLTEVAHAASPDAARLSASAPDLLVEVEQLRGVARESIGVAVQLREVRAEVEELRSSVASWKAEEEDWKRREAQLLADVERLRERVEQGDRERLDAVEDAIQAREQRDALADVLLAVGQRIVIEGPPPQMMALCATDGQRLGAATAWDWLRADLRSKIEAALRAAGRLK
jgi:hypothetical protein